MRKPKSWKYQLTKTKTETKTKKSWEQLKFRKKTRKLYKYYKIDLENMITLLIAWK